MAGGRGSADTVRDARGFATKFYTQEGNYDLVGNNPPVFFIRDAMNLAKADEGLARAVATGPKLEMQVNEERDEPWAQASPQSRSLYQLLQLRQPLIDLGDLILAQASLFFGYFIRRHRLPLVYP